MVLWCVLQVQDLELWGSKTVVVVMLRKIKVQRWRVEEVSFSVARRSQWQCEVASVPATYCHIHTIAEVSTISVL